MGRAIKVIQNGRESIIPNNPANINRLSHFNHMNRFAKNYNELVYTIIKDVSPEEEASIFPTVTKKSRGNQPNANDRLALLEKENSELKTMMLQFMAKNGGTDQAKPETDEPIRRAGRPPKNTDNG